MNPKRLIPILVTAACALGATPAAAAASTVQQASSQNWSGYVVGSSTSNQNFSSVSGSWVQPTATCTSSGGHSAFWVGLGGSGTAQALEQAGTEADCTSGGQASYFAWYELVPAAPVKIALAVHPGDHISSTVKVSGTSVRVQLTDATTGQSVNKTLYMASPDTSSAEWIAEAPSACDQTATNCQPLALTNFGTVKFTNARATTTGGHTGTVSDSSWSAAAVTLTSSAAGYGPAGISYSPSGSSAGATPSGLSSDGSSFSVAYTANSAPATSGAGAGTGAGSASSSSGGGYGGGGYGGGYGYGYGGYGYGYGGNPGPAAPAGGYGYGGYPGPAAGGYGYAYIAPGSAY
ncbi:MAG: G1 family glutamic endopeptidase [Solirubrobacteraceae bacterium]